MKLINRWTKYCIVYSVNTICLLTGDISTKQSSKTETSEFINKIDWIFAYHLNQEAGNLKLT